MIRSLVRMGWIGCLSLFGWHGMAWHGAGALDSFDSQTFLVIDMEFSFHVLNSI